MTVGVFNRASQQILVELEEVVRELLGEHGVPTGSAALYDLVALLMPYLLRSRESLYREAVLMMGRQVARQGYQVRPAELREYTAKALYDGLARPLGLVNSPGRATINVEVLDPESQKSVLETVTVDEAAARDPVNIERTAKKFTAIARRHAQDAARQAVADTSANNEVRLAPTGEQQPGRTIRPETAGGVTLGWARVLTGAENCGWCAMLASRGPVYDEDTVVTTGMGRSYHDNCVVEGTLVSGPAAVAAYRRYFEGEVVTLVTASGREVTVTPNHPVLTDRGWVAAGFLNEGDQLVSSRRDDRTVVGGPDVDHVPARVEDVMGALGMMRTSRWERVPGSPEQFHGDGFDSEVDVVTANNLLWTVGDSAFDEHVAQREFVRTALPRSASSLFFPGADEFEMLGFGALAASDRVVGGGSLGGALFRGHLGGADQSGLGGAAMFESGFPDPSVDDVAGDPVVLRHGVDGFSVGVTVGKIGGNLTDKVRRLPLGAGRFNAAGTELDAEGRWVDVERPRNLLKRLSGFVEFDRLVDKRVWDFSGHVYNLSTEEGWYTANSIMTSNCDCAAVMVIKGRRWEGEDEYKRLADLWDDASSRPTKDELEAGQKKPITRFGNRVKKLMQEDPTQFAPGSLRA